MMRKLYAGLIIFMDNETNDRAGNQLQPGHFKKSVSVPVKNSMGIHNLYGSWILMQWIIMQKSAAMKTGVVPEHLFSNWSTGYDVK